MLHFSFLSFFAGIGGFDLGFERAGMTCIGQVEKDPFCLRVLEHHWPHVKRIEDINNVTGEDFERPFLICGGVPCQPASTAGKRKGTDDDRWLWPQTFDRVRIFKPTWCVFENVRGLTSLEGGVVFDSLLSELEGCGYEVQAFIIPACSVDAPHRRDRVWIVAHSIDRGSQGHPGNGANSIRQIGKIPEPNRSIAENGLCGGEEVVADPLCERSRETREHSDRPKERVAGSGENVPDPTILRRGQGDQNAGGLRQGTGTSRQRSGSPDTLRRESKSRLGRVVDGVSRWLDEPAGIPRVTTEKRNRVNRLRALGNAVVPRIPEIIGRCIIEAELNTPHD